MNARPGGPRYGALSRRTLDEMLAGARVDVASYKRDEMDFVLWKPSKPGEPGWPSPAGIAVLGRPGWHIECSAMSMAKLLEPFGGGLSCDDPHKNVFDIHAGGLDLVFPHHENEIAQSRCALGTERMANIWMHNGFLQVEGRRCPRARAISSPSTICWRPTSSAAANGRARCCAAMLMTHYREPIDFSVAALEEASLELEKFWHGAAWAGDHDGEPSEEFMSALFDDLNLPKAIAELHRLVAEAQVLADVANAGRCDPGRNRRSRHCTENAVRVVAGLKLLGIDLKRFDPDWVTRGVSSHRTPRSKPPWPSASLSSARRTGRRPTASATSFAGPGHPAEGRQGSRHRRARDDVGGPAVRLYRRAGFLYRRTSQGGQVSMIDHIGITVSDFEASKAFYDKAMAPLGASLMMMVPEEYTGGVKVGGYGRERPCFWIQRRRAPARITSTSPSRRAAGPRSMPSMPPPSLPAAATMAGRGCVRTITPTTTAPSSSIPTATISRRSATSPSGAR